MNPHERFLIRNVIKCPSHIPPNKQNKWLKTGRKAQNNQHLLATLDRFHWPVSNYDPPVYIHKHTPEFHLQGIIHKISKVRLFTIDTESDKPTRQFPHSVPALIQIQAIHDENYSTIFIIESQHLPHSSTPLFHLIQTLCGMIFSSINKIMAWGDVQKELRPFEQFNLFDISQVINTVNLQQYFTNHWNKTHPHTPQCLARHQPMDDASESDDVLICLVNSDDLENEFETDDATADYNTCICPDEVRPYKAKNSIWSLQKAIQFVFHQALDKSKTLNFWSCGIDLTLNTWRTHQDKHTRQSLLLYAMNDLFASTNLYFHIKTSQPLFQDINPSIQLNSIQPHHRHDMPLFLILSDSHAKYFPPIVNTPTYKQITKSISGLQWINPYNPALCARSLISSSSISSLLSLCNNVLFIIGTNSIRTTIAPQIITQIDDIIDLIRSQHPHLIHQQNITIASVFPCFKVSSLFPTHDLLSSNINQYNYHLRELSSRKNFHVLDIPITGDHLHHDGMHVHVTHLPNLYNFIQQYFDAIIQHQTKSNRSKRRSRTAITRRNKRRHEKLRKRQAAQTVVRPIARIWKLSDLKDYLKYKNIKFNRLPEIRNHQLRLQFTHLVHQQQAENILAFNDFDDNSYYNWISHKH
jgi:hypothetical protein